MKPHRAGSSLLVVMFAVMIASAMIAVISVFTANNARMTRRAVDRNAAISYGDAVVESLYDQWRAAMMSVNNSTDRSDGLSTADLNAKVSPPSSKDLPTPAGLTLVSADIKAADPYLQPMPDKNNRPLPENGSRSRSRVRLYYLASAQVRFPGPNGNNTVTVRRAFVRAGRNLFDNFFFGTQPETEFHPGPPMYVDGTVYIGGNLYTAHDSLHFLKDVSYLGTHTLNFRKEDSRFGKETPDINSNGLANNWNSSNAPHVGADQKLFDTPNSSLDPNFLDDAINNDSDSDGNPDNDGFHEIVEEEAGPPGKDPLRLDPTTDERLVSSADYRIYVDATNTVSIYAGQDKAPLSTSSAEYQAINAALATNQALKDVRDGDNVRNTVLDLSKLKTATDANKLKDTVGTSDGLLIYFRDLSVGTSVTTNIVNSATGAKTAVTSSHSRGLKLINGSQLPAVSTGGGFSVVSPNPVYIQGNYNTGGNSGTQPASNTASSYTPPNDKPAPTVNGYTAIASAVVGDAVNILSNNWNDANSTASKSSRVASHTTVNTVIVAGNVPTTTSSYSGGIENFVRFHEDWSDKYFTIYGSLALLYSSKEATHPWSSADYTPPNRRWYYDTLLTDNNPPGFHVARSYERGMWFRP